MRWPVLSLLLFACPAPVPPPPPADAGMPLVQDAGPPCFTAFPEQIDFGEIEAGSTAFTRVRITNLSARDVQPRPIPLEPPFSLDGADFEPLAPGGSILVTVRFAPSDGLLHFGRLEVTAAGDCRVVVPLQGLGKGTLSISPSPALSFGLLNPGESRTLELTISNTQRIPVVFERIELGAMQGPSAFSFTSPAPLTIPPGGMRTLAVTASPPEYAEYLQRMTFNGPTTFRELFLHVAGGAPVAQLSPSVIDVPKMDVSPGSFPPSFVERRLRLRNAADAGSPASALQLSPPFFKLLGEDGGLSDELGAFTFFDPLNPGEEQEALFQLQPRSVGMHHYRLIIVTNDPVNPEHQVDLSVNAMTLPQCFLQHPPSLTLMPAPAPDPGSMGVVRFVNITNTSCVLDAVRLGLNGLGYRITDGGVDQIELGPGQAHDVWIAGPDAGSPQRSSLSFHVLGPNSREDSVSLRPPP